jgi:putative peptidoglycan lipid II flippase
VSRPGGGVGAAVAGIAGGAAVIAALTVASRIAGFGRVAVFSRTVEDGDPTCVATVYQSANTVPNIVFEVVAGGALASLVVPLLAGALAAGDREEASRTASALLTWTLTLLIPLMLLGGLVAGPVMDFLLAGGGQACRAAVTTGTRMLLYFLPQIPLYGVAVVLGGVLNAQHRFLLPALAPLLSSVTVAGAYLVFAALVPVGGRQDLTRLDRASDLALAGGTTLGVLVMALCLLPAVARSGLRLRASWRFPPGVAPRARLLAAAGMVTLAAQQASILVVVRLANGRGGPGAYPAYTYAWTLFLLPWAVLAVPVATSAFPRLSAAAHAKDWARFAAVSAVTIRTVVTLSALGAAGLAATAMPVAGLFRRSMPGDLALGLVAFAPGLVGYGLLALISRALFAADRGRASATAVVAGWVTVIVADLALVAVFPPERTVTALGLGNSIGMTVAGVLLLLALRRTAGDGALTGLRRTAAVAVPAGALAGAGGARVADFVGGDVPGSAVLLTLGLAGLAGLVAVVLFLAVVALLDRPTLRATLARLARRRTAVPDRTSDA